MRAPARPVIGNTLCGRRGGPSKVQVMEAVIAELVRVANGGKIGELTRVAFNAIPVGSHVGVAEVITGGLIKYRETRELTKFYLDPDKPFAQTIKQFIEAIPELHDEVVIVDGYIGFGPMVKEDRREAIVQQIRETRAISQIVTIWP